MTSSSDKRTASTDTAFGLAVSTVLSEKQITQLELATRTSRSASYVNQTLTGRKSVSPEWVNLVADALELSKKQRAKLHVAAAIQHGFEIDLGFYKG